MRIEIALLALHVFVSQFVVTDRGGPLFVVDQPAAGFVVTDRNPWYPPVPEKPKAVDLAEMTFYTYDTCLPCGPVKEDDKAGKFSGHFKLKHFDITKAEAPKEITTVPAMQWKGFDGRTWTYPDPDYAENDPRRGYVGAAKLIEMWKATQKPAVKAVNELDGLSPHLRAMYDDAIRRGWSHDQIRRYAVQHGLIAR